MYNDLNHIVQTIALRGVHPGRIQGRQVGRTEEGGGWRREGEMEGKGGREREKGEINEASRQ